MAKAANPRFQHLVRLFDGHSTPCAPPCAGAASSLRDCWQGGRTDGNPSSALAARRAVGGERGGRGWRRPLGRGAASRWRRPPPRSRRVPRGGSSSPRSLGCVRRSAARGRPGGGRAARGADARERVHDAQLHAAELREDAGQATQAEGAQPKARAAPHAPLGPASSFRKQPPSPSLDVFAILSSSLRFFAQLHAARLRPLPDMAAPADQVSLSPRPPAPVSALAVPHKAFPPFLCVTPLTLSRLLRRPS